MKNKNIDGMPENVCKIEILKNKQTILCTWTPFDKLKYTPENMPYKVYLGTAEANGIGYHAWANNAHEFEKYRIVN